MPGYRPRRSDPNVHYEYHMGQQGHATDNCWELKNKIQDLIESKLVQLNFVESLKPLIHEEATINMVYADLGKSPLQASQQAHGSKQEGSFAGVMLGKEKRENRFEAYQILEEKITMLANRVETLEWVMKYVVKQIESSTPKLEAQPIEKRAKVSPLTLKTPSQDKQAY